MWKILSGKMLRRYDEVQGERKDKAQAATNQGPPRVAEDPAMVHSPPRANTEQPQTDGERRQTVRGPPQVAEEPPVMFPPPPHADTKQQPQTDGEHRQTVRGPPQVAKEPPVMVCSPPHTDTEQQHQTDGERRQTVREPPQVAEEPPVMLPPPLHADTEQQPQTNGEHRQTVRGPPQVAKEPPVMVHPPHADTEQRPQTDGGHRQTVRGPPQVAEEPPVMVRSLPHANTEKQPQTDGEHRQTVRGPLQVAEEPPVMMHSLPHANTEKQPQTDGERRQTVRGPPQVVEELPVMVSPPPHTNTEQQPQTDGEHRQTVRGPPQVAKEPSAMLHPLPQINAGRPLADTKHSETAQGLPHVPEEPATASVEDLETDDIVIAVMGPTGSGKSTFIRVASGLDTRGVGHTLRSFTSHVIAIKFWDQESGRHVVLVDTPGFDDTFKSDLEILNMISDWLNSSYKKQKLLSGILYLHRITDNRMAGTPLKNLRVFRKLCGRDALEKVYLTTTMWDEVDPSVGQRRLEELRQEYWRAMVLQGAQIACCRNDDDSPKKIIQQILDQEAVRKTLLLQEEMSDLKKELKETEAGQELYSVLEKLIEKQMVLLQRIDKERKAASEPSVLAELQTEYTELRLQIDDKLRQMQELKLSRLKNLLRFFSRKRE